ncbi:MAG TPA: hypothetical protein VJY43_06570, partial [Methanocorpusculum sp.]|nr:hypothetical protein [Methanocorpusculum sp.]
RNNSEDMFASKFDSDFEKKLVSLYLQNDQFMGLIMRDEGAKKLIRDELRHEIYRHFRKAGEAGVL